MKPKVLVTRPILPVGIDMLKARCDVVLAAFDDDPTPEALIALAAPCQAIVALLTESIDRRLLETCERLLVVANHAVGYDNIDVAAARSLGVRVTHTPGVLTDATAEIAFSLMICLARQIVPADRFTREGRFTRWDPGLFLGDELRGRTVGIVGMGRIGRAMAERCRAFGMNVVYHNRHRLSAETESALGADYLDLAQLLARADVVSLHCPRTPETHHLIDEDRLALMKPDAYIVNTARGDIIDESALVRALKNGTIKGAGLDVYEFEPKISAELMEMDNVVLLPHIGSATREARSAMSETAARNVLQVLDGRAPDNLIPELRDVRNFRKMA